MEQTITLSFTAQELNVLNTIIVNTKAVEFGIALQLFNSLQKQLVEKQKETAEQQAPLHAVAAE